MDFRMSDLYEVPIGKLPIRKFSVDIFDALWTKFRLEKSHIETFFESRTIDLCASTFEIFNL